MKQHHEHNFFRKRHYLRRPAPPVTRSGFKHDGMERYVGRKVKAKNRRYNTIQNAQPPEYQSIAAAEAYQLAKDGDDGDA